VTDTKKYELTLKNFVKYIKYCQKWIPRLGLVSWSIEYNLFDKEECDDIDGMKAMVYYNCIGRVATIILNKSWNEEPTDKRLERSAVHELMELLLKPLSILADASDKTIEAEEHKIIRVFENVLVP